MKTIKMKKADWEKWDAALRSGKYAQAEQTMYDPNTGSYCCLGILQHCLSGEVERSGGGLYAYRQVPSAHWCEDFGIDMFTYYPRAVHKTLDTTTNPMTNTGKTVAEMNDSGKSFVEIADAIKEIVEFTDENLD